MGKYAPGLTFGQVCNLEKEQIIHALQGEIVCGEDENGFAYMLATAEECKQVILGAYDEVVYQAQQAIADGRAMDRLFKEVTGKDPAAFFPRLLKLSEEERARDNDYQYEHSPGRDEDEG